MAIMRPAVPAYLVARAGCFGDDAVVLLHEAFEHGRTIGREEGRRAMRDDAVALAGELAQTFERARTTLSAAQLEMFAYTYAWSPHPVVTAYFDAAADGLVRYVERLRAVRLAPPRRADARRDRG